MAQARDPWLYREAAVPDTLDGRFEMIVLQLFCFIYGGTFPLASLSPTANAASPCSDSAHTTSVGTVGTQEQLKDPSPEASRPSALVAEGVRLIAEVSRPEQEQLKSAAPLAQAVMEIMIDDMDRNLREMGVGDMGVSRRIKHMGNAINGRLQAYFQAAKDGGWEEALRRNVYATQTPELVTDAAVQALCGYMRERLGV